MSAGRFFWRESRSKRRWRQNREDTEGQTIPWLPLSRVQHQPVLQPPGQGGEEPDLGRAGPGDRPGGWPHHQVSQPQWGESHVWLILGRETRETNFTSLTWYVVCVDLGSNVVLSGGGGGHHRRDCRVENCSRWNLWRVGPHTRHSKSCHSPGSH